MLRFCLVTSTVLMPWMCDEIELATKLPLLWEECGSKEASSCESSLYDCYLWMKRLLYSCAHCADCELCLVGHDVSGLDVTVIHRVLECSSAISVLMANVTIEGDFGSSPGKRQITTIRAEQYTLISPKSQFLQVQYPDWVDFWIKVECITSSFSHSLFSLAINIFILVD